MKSGNTNLGSNNLHLKFFRIKIWIENISIMVYPLLQREESWPVLCEFQSYGRLEIYTASCNELCLRIML